MNVKQALEDVASEIPHKEAIVLGAERITYGELDENSNRVANALLKLGMKKGTHVAILMSHSPKWVINYFGVIKGGGIAVLLNTALKAPELDSLLRDSDSEILVTEKKFSRMLSSVSTEKRRCHYRPCSLFLSLWLIRGSFWFDYHRLYHRAYP